MRNRLSRFVFELGREAANKPVGFSVRTGREDSPEIPSFGIYVKPPDRSYSTHSLKLILRNQAPGVSRGPDSTGFLSPRRISHGLFPLSHDEHYRRTFPGARAQSFRPYSFFQLAFSRCSLNWLLRLILRETMVAVPMVNRERAR